VLKLYSTNGRFPVEGFVRDNPINLLVIVVIVVVEVFTNL